VNGNSPINRFLGAVALAVLCLAQAGAAQAVPDDKEARVDRLFTAWNKPDVPGAAVSVVMDGKPLLVKGYGCADLERSRPITPQTLFNAASLAKQFTAAAVLMLEAEGKISLQDEVRAHLPEFPDFGRPVTIRHLLYHTSGLRDYGGLIQMSGGRVDDPIISRDVLKLVSRQRELNFPPGTEFAYSNAGYIVLAEIVGRVSGLKFRDWIQARLFLPLDMKAAFFRDDLTDPRGGSVCSYSRSADGRFEKQADNDATPGPGSLFISAAEMALWLASFQARAAAGAPWNSMAAPGTLDDGRLLHYAAGLIVGRYRGLPILHHSGGWAGFRGETVFFPEQRLAVAVLSNNSSLDPTALSRQIAGIYLEGQFPSSQPAAVPVAVEGAVLDSYVGRYWLNGEQMLQVIRRESRLFVQMSGGLPIEVFPESEEVFVFRVADAKVQFHRDASGGIPKLTFWRGAYAMPCERIPSEPWTPADPSAYCGQYHSDELETTLTIELGEKGLRIPFARRGDLVLVPMAEERFAGKESSTKFRFVRGEDGRIRELRFSMLDAWNVRFSRVEKDARSGRVDSSLLF
jgi:CubicO group peptidase (beta-lactamase class C family)